MKRVLLCLLLLPAQVWAKVLLMTHSYNRPDFIELQVRTFKKFLQDDYEFVVFNDAPGHDMQKQIEQTCQRLGLRHFYIPQHLHQRQSPGHRHMDGIKYALEQVGFNYDGIVTLIDSDMFLIKPLSIEKYLEGYDIAGELQGRKNDEIEVRYLSPVFVPMNMKTLPNKRTLSFEGGYIHDLACDVGAHTYYYFQNNASAKRKLFPCLHIAYLHLNCPECKNVSCLSCEKKLCDSGFDDKVIKFIQACPSTDVEFFMNHTLLHYRSGTNWNNSSAQFHAIKSKALYDFMDKILN